MSMIKMNATLCSTDPSQTTYRYHVLQYLNTRMTTERTQFKLKKSKSCGPVRKITFQYKLYLRSYAIYTGGLLYQFIHQTLLCLACILKTYKCAPRVLIYLLLST